MLKDVRAEQVKIFPAVAFWTFLASMVGVLAGSASAVFLWLLNWATLTRESHFWLIALLPLGGLLSGILYHTIGQSIERGNQILIDEIHEPKSPIPFRMAPLILFSTVLTHLFGGSAGREGTAVQMAGALSDQLSVIFKKGPLSNFIGWILPERDEARNRRILLMAGISAGFGSIFGTPIAGAIFGLEVLSIGRMDYEAILPCFAASIAGDLVAEYFMNLLGVHHDAMAGLVPDVSVGPVTVNALLYCALAGVIFGLVGMIFSRANHWMSSVFKSAILHSYLRPFVGGLIVAALVFALGNTRYIGLGTTWIAESFQHPLLPWDFAGKIVFTVLTLGAGFKGGEVTPLFYIGSTLGNALAQVIPLPIPLLAATGFVAVFAGAANTPITCIFMASELFGSQMTLFAAVACVASYIFSGHAGIYSAQRIASRKYR
jgi:H+/Cl- antiporter ClcA